MSHPQSIGRYRILRLLGSGAMGDVFLAEDPNIGRELAIKTVRVVGGSPEDVADRKQRLLREAKAAGKFVHPNVVTLFDADEIDGTLYLAFEYVPPGVDLAQRMIQGTKGGPQVTLGQALRWVREIAQALEFAHKNDIVHRDIKPSNVLIAEDGTAKVADFGIAKLLGPGTELTRTGSVVGSPQYMSPEQVRGEDLDGRSDVFSLGVVFYELLCGIRPFTGDTLSTLVFEILSKEPPPVGSLRPSLPGDLVALAHRMLAKDRNHRSASATEVVKAIRELETSMPSQMLDAAAAPSDVEETRRMATEISAQIDAQAAQASGQDIEAPTVQSRSHPPTPPVPPPTPDSVYADPTLVASQAAASPPRGTPPPVPAQSPEMSTSLPARGAADTGSTKSNTVRNVILGLGVLAFLGLVVLVGGWFVVRSMAPGLLPPALGGEPAHPEIAESSDPPAEASGDVTDESSAEDVDSDEATSEAAESVEDESAEDPAALDDLRNEVAEADREPPPSTEPVPPPSPVSTAPPPPPAPPPSQVESRPPPPPVQTPEPTPEPDREPVYEPPPRSAPEPEVDEELERWQDAATRVNREMSTGLHFRFDIKPKDLYVIVRVWPKGQDMIVKGGADTFKDGRKGQDMTLPGSGDHLLQLLVNGEVQHSVLVHASAASTQTTTITLDLR